MHPHFELIKNKILKLRPRLMDTSRRNALINNSLSARSAAFIRIVDEKPQNIFDKLVVNEESLSLAPLPALEEDPLDENNLEFREAFEVSVATDQIYLDTIEEIDQDNDENSFEKQVEAERLLKDRVREQLGYSPRITTPEITTLATHARNHGIVPSYDLPLPDFVSDDDRHDDDELQTLVLKKQLQARLARIRSRDNTMSEERGLKTLYLALGFLVWRDPASSDPNAKYKSPLILLPVNLEASATPQGLEFSISSRDDAFYNPVLKYKLQTELGLELWEPKDISTEFDIENYFAEIGKGVKDQIGWRVVRQAVIGVYPFQGIELYNDINPEEVDFSNFDVISTLFSGLDSNAKEPSYQAFTEDDLESDISESLVPKIVVDADSSQYLSLVKSAAGQNLAIEGPPGSGKSQTIVNIVANAISQSKKVLFVAQKGTALEVVLSRLSALGLDSLVLPLMGRKGDKEKFYESLSARIDERSRIKSADFEYSRLKKEIKEKREHLSRYINTLKATVGGTFITVHQVLGMSAANSDKDIDNDLVATIPNYDSMDSVLDISFVSRICSKAEAWSGQLEHAKVEDGSLWQQISSRQKDQLLLDKISTAAKDAVSKIDSLKKSYSEENVVNFFDSLPVKNISFLLSDASKAFGDDIVTPQSWNIIGDNFEDIRELTDKYISAQKSLEKISTSSGISISNLKELVQKHDSFGDLLWLFDENLITDCSNTDIAITKESSEKLAHTFRGILDFVEKQNDQNGFSELSLKQVKLLSIIAKEFPFLRDKRICRAISVNGLESADETFNSAISTLQKLRENLVSLDMMPSRKRLFELNAIVSESSLLNIFSTKLRDCKRECNRLFGTEKFNKATVQFHLNELISGQEEWSRSSSESVFGSTISEALFDHVKDAGERLEDLGLKLKTSRELDSGFIQTLSPSILSSIDGISSSFDSIDFNWNWDDLNNKLLEYDRTIEVIDRIIVCDLVSILDDSGIKTAHDVNRIAGSLKKAQSIALSSDQLESTLSKYDNLLFERGILSLDRLSIISSLTTIYSVIFSSPLHEMVISADVSESYENITELIASLTVCDSVISNVYRLCDEYGFDGFRPPNFADVISKIRLTAKEGGGPSKVIQRSLILDEVDQFGLLSFVETVLSKYSLSSLSEMLRLSLIKSLSNAAYKSHGSIISEFSGYRLDQLRDEYQSSDRDLLSLSSEQVLTDAIAKARPPIGVGTGRKSHYSDMSLINHQLQLKRRISPSKLVKRARDALMELHPCWMMVPTAVASFLPREELFDLVVIDEASQMTPEHSLSALMRAKQAIVVGDTNQLPPTNFFKAAADIEDEDDDESTIEESILELANRAFYPKHRLLWHYRSRHESLIAFSNNYIYDNDLVIFPSPGGERERMGVELTRVDGVYQKGLNPVESSTVVDYVVDFMERDTDRSIGVVTMNQSQMEHIESMILRHSETNDKVRQYIEKWAVENEGLERFFVKNIENVQGDERDVIFISTVYGKDSLGKFRQAFGPINGVAGKRRLNVLFTRAKEKIHTFTSIPMDQLNPGEHNQGGILLKRWLEYSATGQLGEALNTGSRSMFGPDSPFEEHVIERIESLGYQAVPQVGVSNYFIDIGVRHPSYDSGYICGVECDGASYHSSKSARDRDVLRQEVLEGLGWDIYRIWSTDWFIDSKNQTDLLKTYLDMRLAKLCPDATDDTEDTNADQMESISPQEGRIASVGSRVVLQYHSGPRAGMRSKFILVDSSSATSSMGHDPLPIACPLGVEVNDSAEGDTVSFEVQGKLVDVEILEVFN